MRWLLVALLSVVGCAPCLTSSDCDPGEHCEFTSGECIKGCESDAECSRVARCDVTKGKCVPRSTPNFADAGTMTSSTSTTSDGGS